ncbi:hypothetical protein MTO96_012087 [Rhipicephalus appendiculatus]
MPDATISSEESPMSNMTSKTMIHARCVTNTACSTGSSLSSHSILCPDLEKGYQNVHRLLKDGGECLTVNFTRTGITDVWHRMYQKPRMEALPSYLYVPLFKMNAKVPEEKQRNFIDAFQSTIYEASDTTAGPITFDYDIMVTHSQKRPLAITFPFMQKSLR